MSQTIRPRWFYYSVTFYYVGSYSHNQKFYILTRAGCWRFSYRYFTNIFSSYSRRPGRGPYRTTKISHSFHLFHHWADTNYERLSLYLMRHFIQFGEFHIGETKKREQLQVVSDLATDCNGKFKHVLLFLNKIIFRT